MINGKNAMLFHYLLSESFITFMLLTHSKLFSTLQNDFYLFLVCKCLFLLKNLNFINTKYIFEALD